MKTFTLILLSIIFLFCSAMCFAHSGSVKGFVTDADTKKPVEGALIYISETRSSGITDAFGSFFLKNIPAGNYTVRISLVGYDPLLEQIRIEDGVTTDQNFRLHLATVKMDAVTVNAKKEGALNILSGLDLAQRPVNTSQDLVRLVPGLFTSQHQGGGKAEQMFLRGFDVDHGTDVSVNVDGIPVNMPSHAHGQGYADLHWMMPELVDKLSFGKGPYEISKGNFATAGWVDFKTKDQLDNSFVKLEGGMYGYLRGAAGLTLLDRTVNGRTEDAYVAGEYGYNRGYFDAPQNFNRTNLTAKYTTRFADGKLFSITLGGFRSSWDASGQIPDRAVNDGLVGRFGEIDAEKGKTSRYNLNLQYTQKIGAQGSFKSNLYVSYYDFLLYSNFTFYLNDSVNGDQIRQKESRVLSGYNAAYTHRCHFGSVESKTEIGAGIRYDNVMDDELSHTLNMNTTLERLALGDVQETNAYGYFNQTAFLTSHLVLQAGVRYDGFIHVYNNKLAAEAQRSMATTGAFSPKAGLYYNFSDRARVYVNYGTGFHSNDTRVVVPQQGNSVLPRAHSFDLGTIIKPYKKLLLAGAVWMLDLDQEFVYVGDEAVVEPSGRTRRMGADLSVRYELLPWLFADADLTYTKARARDEAAGNDYIPLAPMFTAIGGVSVKPFRNATAGIRVRHMGNRPANEDRSVIAKGYTVYDLVAGYTVKKYEFGLQIQNLTNTAWNEAQFDTETRLRGEAASSSGICFTPGTPFFLKLSATYRF